MQEKILNYIKDNFHKPWACIAGFFLLTLILASIDGFFSQITPLIGIPRRYIYPIFFILWIFFWLYKRYYFPKNKKNNIGLVICIKTENNKQKNRLKNDFVKRLKELIRQNNLSQPINILLLNNYQAELMCEIMDDYSKQISELRVGKIIPKKIPKEVKKWFKIQKKIHGHFFVWGDIKERQDEDNKYFLNIEALVVHNPVNISVQKEITNDFLTVWYKQISFQEKIEFKGFILTADLVYIAVKYITGIAALISGDLNLAIQLHSSLEGDFSKFNPLPPNLQKIKKKTQLLLAEENLIFARWFFSQNNLEKTEEYLNQSLVCYKENYGGYLLKSLIEFSIIHNPSDALKAVRIAKKYSGNDGTWRYNEGFLLMYLEKWDEAMKVYKNISEKSYPDEDNTLNTIYSFNEEILKNEPNKIQSYFIIGYLKYKKEQNWPEALNNFQLFLNKSKDIQKYEFLKEKASSYKIDCENKMNLEHE